MQKVSSLVFYIANLAGSTILLLVLGHFFIGAAASIHGVLVSDNNQLVSGDSREISPVYDGMPNYKFYWKEFVESRSTHFEPYFHWRRDPYQGEYINISTDGVRSSTLPKSKADLKKIFVFGGSTVWGTGSMGKHTIPSFIQQEINLMNKPYEVFNFGETGFRSTQELNLLLLQLSQGNIPDTVIFYDGVNDGYGGVYSPAIPRGVQNLRERFKKQNIGVTLFNASNYKRLANFFTKNQVKRWDNKVSQKIKVNSRSVVDLYQEHIKQVKALGKEYGFKAFFFWQPNLFSAKEKTSPYENSIISKSSPVFIDSQRQLYIFAKSVFSNRSNENIFFLGDVFNHNNEPIYIDWCHMGPEGNRVIAKKIVEGLFEPHR